MYIEKTIILGNCLFYVVIIVYMCVKKVKISLLRVILGGFYCI